MLNVFRGVSLVAATMATGLVAGLFYAFFYAIMPGLNKADDRTFVTAMQRVNVAIVNGWFMLIFMGALLFTLVAASLHLGRDARGVLLWVVIGLAFYVATLVITIGLNIPLNNQLEAAGDPDKISNLAAVRESFEATWVRWNTARAVTNIAAFGSLLWALVQFGRVPGQ